MDYAQYNFENGHSENNLNVMLHSIPGDPRFYPQNYVNYDPYYDQSSNFDLSLPSRMELETKSDDELFIETWLSKIGKINLNLDSTIEIETKALKTQPKSLGTKPRTQVKINAIKSSLKKCLEIMEKLENTQNILKTNVETMCSNDWKKKTVEIGVLKDELTMEISQFQNPETLKNLQYNLKKRNKKRLKQRNQKSHKIIKQKQWEEKNKQMHKQIDQWLENMKEQVERAKMEEKMKKDADCVLSEVTKKKSDGRKHMSLITALIKLRNVREIVATQRGEKLLTEDHLAFNKSTETLVKIWENSLRTYSKEEQGLKIMLEQNANEDVKITYNKEKRIAQQWENVLFGSNYVPAPIYWGLTSAERDLETFIAIRKSWDTFLRNDCGSKIPVGWILPSANTNSDWSKYLLQ